MMTEHQFVVFAILSKKNFAFKIFRKYLQETILLMNADLWYYLSKLKRSLQLNLSLDKYSVEWQILQGRISNDFAYIHDFIKESIQEENIACFSIKSLCYSKKSYWVFSLF